MRSKKQRIGWHNNYHERSLGSMPKFKKNVLPLYSRAIESITLAIELTVHLPLHELILF